MRFNLLWEVLPFLLIMVQISEQAKKQKTQVISDVTDFKDFKKLLRTKTNILILYINVPKSSQLMMDVFKETADAMKGQATLVIIDCSNSLARLRRSVSTDRTDRSRSVTPELRLNRSSAARRALVMSRALEMASEPELPATPQHRSVALGVKRTPGGTVNVTDQKFGVQRTPGGNVRFAAEPFSETKKLCKKLKVSTDNAYYIKHYKDGEFHKDYDRSETVRSISNFLRDPTGDLPWEEDPGATDVFHLADAEALTKFLKKSAGAYKKSIIMFYAPWCGYCKTMKPEYVQAAVDLKGEALLAAIDVAKPGNTKIRQMHNITGFPTLLYYEKGQLRFPYNGENKRQAIVDFMRDPTAHLQHKLKKEIEDDSWSPDTDVVHLTAENFDNILSKAEHALVVFYAPWCGHCKRIKPEFEKAAARIKSEKINGILAAVDATKQPSLASRFGVKGYPTLKYFSNGQYKFDAGHARQEEQIISFIEKPQEPPPPPPAEKPWAEEESAVRHLDAATFRQGLRKIKHALVMFYAPWCGHCKSTKPEFVRAAEQFADELMVAFGAVDCTTAQDLCAGYDVRGYPTIKYFSYFDKLVKDYSGGRKQADFVSYIHSQMDRHQTAQKAPKTHQEAGFGANVVLSTDNDFESIVASPTPTFIMFYATWCGHCVTAKPAFSRLATTVKGDKIPVQVIAVDAAENPKVADLAGIETLPTFKIYANGEFIADYTGGRTTDEMLSFCKSHAKVKDEL